MSLITANGFVYRIAIPAKNAPKIPATEPTTLAPAPVKGVVLLEATPPVDATEAVGATPVAEPEVVIGKGADEVTGVLATTELVVATGAAEVATADVEAGAAAAVEDAATGPADAAQAHTAEAEACVGNEN